ncbi:hypothetical protein N6H18_16435 [Reichenbachiella agarivorans]|uniref:DinB superfamily protein n=1 Tax=Reichenbachiella agarivorans TaxID=2979464 RepID=A0ABY6CQ67_9BACT|nr:hypothetical protein [Reichenbachiella agarivorans]UXP31934.1 hypothetical protein N6H18_16435 [Reichenbachiella agarivorans]
MKHILTFAILLVSIQLHAQKSTDYYYEIPDAPDHYSAGTVAARLLDGLGYRYYWATASLTETDLQYQPNAEARTTQETVDHIYDLTRVVYNSVLQQATDVRMATPEMTFAQKREATLKNIEEASLLLRNSKDKDFKNYNVVFLSDKGSKEYPFWNDINGPIADAIWHCGQISSFRRSTGNPLNSKANMMDGKVKE